ncbi:hypothetical protein [Actinoplanes sp. DH11]|uniref:hypothetical protein n=1 Tax=Actinoplanes sp. DH11 TaxID=2857011 RepID=UPI001E64D78C|nr:hypothetical protein [Actinoplanes sp. DH11]
MLGTALHTELTAVRALVSHGLTEVSDAGDIGQFWIRSACTRLSAADAVLVEAAGVVAGPVQAVVAAAVAAGAVLLSATAARAAGLGTAGVLIIAALILVALAAAAPTAGRWARTAVGRRRLARVPVPAVPGHTPRWPGLIVVPETLLHARVRLVSTILRRAGSGRWGAAELRVVADADPVVRHLAEADLLLCQAVDCLERYLDDLAKG